MIVTVTPNPNLDRTIHLRSFRHGQTNRAEHGPTVHPSGKGVNVARALARNGHPTAAIFPAGGKTGEHLQALLRQEGVPFAATPVAGNVRWVISLIEPGGVLTQINEPGPPLSSGETDLLLEEAERAARHATFVAAAGSLPPGHRGELYAALITALGEAGVPVALDTGGAALLAALQARPALVKPNLDELAEAAGTRPATLGEVIRAAEELRRQGAGTVLATLGSDGAVLLDQSGALHGESRPEPLRNPVGAGDALLAGFLAGGGGPGGLAEGLAWAAAACREPDTMPPLVTPQDRAGVTIHDQITSRRELAPPDATDSGKRR